MRAARGRRIEFPLYERRRRAGAGCSQPNEIRSLRFPISIQQRGWAQSASCIRLRGKECKAIQQNLAADERRSFNWPIGFSQRNRQNMMEIGRSSRAHVAFSRTKVAATGSKNHCWTGGAVSVATGAPITNRRQVANLPHIAASRNRCGRGGFSRKGSADYQSAAGCQPAPQEIVAPREEANA